MVTQTTKSAVVLDLSWTFLGTISVHFVIVLFSLVETQCLGHPALCLLQSKTARWSMGGYAALIGSLKVMHQAHSHRNAWQRALRSLARLSVRERKHKHAESQLNILKTTPIPNKIGSYGTKVAVRMSNCCTSVCHILCEIPSFNRRVK